MTNKKTAGKTADAGKERVVLNLNLEQANELKRILEVFQEPGESKQFKNIIAEKLAARLNKTINNREAEALSYPRGVKQMQEEGALEMPGDVMEAITQAAQEVIDEECPECDKPLNECDCKEEN